MSPLANSDSRRFEQALKAAERAATGIRAESGGEGSAATYRGRIVLDCLMEQAEQAAHPTHDTLAGLYEKVSSHLPPYTADASHYAEVAEELGLRPGLASQELTRMRRAFALANHPDRFGPEHHDQATRRMAIANILIDRALKAGRIEG
jgi:hypothetical protein